MEQYWDRVGFLKGMEEAATAPERVEAILNRDRVLLAEQAEMEQE